MDHTENIGSPSLGTIEHEHPFEAFDGEHTHRLEIRMVQPKQPSHTWAGREQGERLMSGKQETMAQLRVLFL